VEPFEGPRLNINGQKDGKGEEIKPFTPFEISKGADNHSRVRVGRLKISMIKLSKRGEVSHDRIERGEQP